MRPQLDLHVPPAPARRRRAALEGALREAVRDGRLAPGERLPSSRTLASDLGLARGTVVEAYGQLAAEGWLLAERGRGTLVAHDVGGRLPRPAAEVRRQPPAGDFRLGRPDLSAFPRREWLAALRRALAAAPDHALGPGDPRGAPELRSALAAYAGRTRGVRTDPGLMVVCSGFTQGLRLVCEALAALGHQSAALEDPCLPDHRAVAGAAGLEVRPLPVDPDGALLAGDSGAAVLTPAHQCPLGPTLTPLRRTAFLRAARERGNYLIEDDYDGEFRYDRQPVGALQGLAPDRVVYAGTASKTLGPGLRLGWLALPPQLLEPVVEAKRRADRGTPVLEQLALAELVAAGGLDRHVRRMRRRYRRRRDELVALLAERLPGVRLLGTAAGLHAVAAVGDEAAVVARARERSVALTPLAPFWHAKPRMQGVVLGYGTPSEHAWPAALGALESVLGGA